MTDKKTIDRIESGEAVILNRKAIQWGAIATVLIFLLGQVMIFGIWKGSVDEKIQNKAEAKEVQLLQVKVNSIEENGTKVSQDNAKKTDVLIHNLKRLMEKSGVKWESLEVGK